MSEFGSRAPESGSHVFSLTQIRHLMRVEFGRAQRYGYPLSCLVVACDHLDDLRDRHGYAFKEMVVDDVAELLQGSTRNCDYLGRMLDDRLMAILPHTGPTGAQRAAERLLAAGRELFFESGGKTVAVTLSIGLATYRDGNTLFFDRLVQAAEDALVAASEAGGDRCVVGQPAPGRGSADTGP